MSGMIGALLVPVRARTGVVTERGQVGLAVTADHAVLVNEDQRGRATCAANGHTITPIQTNANTTSTTSTNAAH